MELEEIFSTPTPTKPIQIFRLKLRPQLNLFKAFRLELQLQNILKTNPTPAYLKEQLQLHHKCATLANPIPIPKLWKLYKT